MRDVDDEAIREYGIDVLSLMENAGSRTAELARKMLGGNAANKSVACLVGRGNNGGDGLVAARILHNWGARVVALLGAVRGDFHDVPAKQLAIVQRMGLPVVEGEPEVGRADLIIDALLGYNSRGNPRGQTATLIDRANASGAPILALDIPSGMDPTTGEPGQPCIAAAAMITLGFPKTGFLNPVSRPSVGELYLCDISLPREIYGRHSMERTFKSGTIVRIMTAH
jgi:NAD(P)H-hydrate epimerase